MAVYDVLSRQDGSQEVRLQWHQELEERITVQAKTVQVQTRTFAVAAIDTGTEDEWTLTYVTNLALDGADRWAQLVALCDLHEVIKLVVRLGETYYGKVYSISRSPMTTGTRRAKVTVSFKRVDIA